MEGGDGSAVTSGAELAHPPDTWADMRGWGKGLLWVNGFNLGWYWPLLGPQMRVFVPGPLLRPGTNEIVMLEFARVPDDPAGKPHDIVYAAFTGS